MRSVAARLEAIRVRLGIPELEFGEMPALAIARRLAGLMEPTRPDFAGFVAALRAEVPNRRIMTDRVALSYLADQVQLVGEELGYIPKTGERNDYEGQ
jgi:hypothetical protein